MFRCLLYHRSVLNKNSFILLNMRLPSVLPFSFKNCFESLYFLFKKQHLRITLQSRFNQFYPLYVTSSIVTASRDQCYSIHDINIPLLANCIPNTENADKLNLIVADIKNAISKQRRFPEYITEDQLRSMYNLESRTQRSEYLTYLFKREKLKISEAEKKIKKKQERELMLLKKAIEPKNPHLDYGLGRNAMLLSVWSHSINKYYKKRLANAALFGEKIVFDLSYDSHMTEKEMKACVTQLKLVYSANKTNLDPYDLYFCNTASSSNCFQYLTKHVPGIANSLISLTDKSYLDIFPKENLVYLSPHSQETLKVYDHNAVYIIGAFVDTIKKEHVSLHKAEQEEIKSYSLPLDDYIMWGAGTKSLTINQVFEIMLTLKNTGDWKKAFEVIPMRKIRKLEVDSIEKSVQDKIFVTNTSNKTV